MPGCKLVLALAVACLAAVTHAAPLDSQKPSDSRPVTLDSGLADSFHGAVIDAAKGGRCRCCHCGWIACSSCKAQFDVCCAGADSPAVVTDEAASESSADSGAGGAMQHAPAVGPPSDGVDSNSNTVTAKIAVQVDISLPGSSSSVAADAFFDHLLSAEAGGTCQCCTCGKISCSKCKRDFKECCAGADSPAVADLP